MTTLLGVGDGDGVGLGVGLGVAVGWVETLGVAAGRLAATVGLPVRCDDGCPDTA
jgi:hypothetical protein